MDFLVLSGYFLALLVGISLGLIGSGGSILTVPILVYILGFDPVIATGYSLFVVGSTALVGGIRNAFYHNVKFNLVAIFGIPSLLTAYWVRAYIIPSLPDIIIKTDYGNVTKSLLLMLIFAIVMVTAAIKMIRSTSSTVVNNDFKVSNIKLIISGIGVGLLAGAVGAGGGFLIIPTLIFIAKLPIKKAVGTSLFIIAIQSLAGFVGDINAQIIDWAFLIPFTLASIIGIFIGIYASKKIEGHKLKTGFGYFVLVMGAYILIKELIIK
ncbi:sulfite exporter TauE/SafE family protein [Flavobacterium arcticum]|uniref:Probable membrane transporter protein n=1 Tax=Flavobacterium arcticum TaxID=1784713 RepID=A0A345HAF9_9FLAO|nr:sulfite exporter TauE/SafE family protein [Flavobacterium arcticum]AXG73569.1 sulfite exporter TauE/SafE family protein [Flavobacterium arcticum]KAF2513362.1 sulfite exporter TauE/SafE family protein [Flavobacterium arcticum]